MQDRVEPKVRAGAWRSARRSMAVCPRSARLARPHLDPSERCRPVAAQPTFRHGVLGQSRAIPLPRGKIHVVPVSQTLVRLHDVRCSGLSQCNGVSLRKLRAFRAASTLRYIPRSDLLSKGEPPLALGLGNTIATLLRLRTCRFATVEAATRLARLRSDLATAAGPCLGSAKAPALATACRCLVRCQSHVPVLPVRPHDARARARILVALFVLHSA
jgi:hypothetical protein